MAVNAYTGQDDGVNDTLQPIVGAARNAGQGINDALFRDPASRSALLQIGLGLMQPTAIGQTTMGHIGQAIGSGGEAVSRIEAEDLAQRKVEDELDKSNRTLDIRQQEADAYSKAQESAAKRGTAADKITLEQIRQQGRERLLGTKNYAADAYEIYHRLGNVAFNPATASASDLRFVNKTPTEIANMLRADDVAAGGNSGIAPPPGSGGAAKSQDDEARAWAEKNPNDPRAARIRQRLGM